MTIVHLDELPDDVRAHLALLERESEIPDGYEPLDVADNDYSFPDEE